MNRIREARAAVGMSQKYVAVTLGVTGLSASNWERGKTQPTPENLKSLVALFGVSVDHLLGNDAPPASMMANSSESKFSPVPIGEEAKQGMIAALEKEMAKYLAKRAEAMEIYGMDDDTYEMALNVLKAMKK